MDKKVGYNGPYDLYGGRYEGPVLVGPSDAFLLVGLGLMILGCTLIPLIAYMIA